MRIGLLVALLVLSPAVASAQTLDGRPAMRVGTGAYGPSPRIVHAVTPAMRVWVLRGSGPVGARVLGSLDVEARGDDADAALDRLQERAFALHADAIVHVRIEHGAGHTITVHGTAVRFG